MSGLLKLKTVRETVFYRRLKADKVQCTLCERRCVLADGQRGFCKTRLNIKGKLYTLVYGDISAIESRPIEIKPFFHYYPGSTATTISTWSCNFRCPWCQNTHLSRVEPNPKKARYMDPEDVLTFARDSRDDGICISFQEPTLLTDFAVNLFRLASREGLYCCYVSNGYMTLEALKTLVENGLTGLKIDVKGNRETYLKYCGGVNVDVPWRNAREAKSLGVHVEIVNLVVTGVNDDENTIREVVKRHLKEVGPETPIHFTRYFPAYKFRSPPTKVEILEEAYRIAREEGILYPYIGNVSSHPYENTYCPNCGVMVIKRFNYRILRFDLEAGGKCFKCGFQIKLTGRYVVKPYWLA